MQKQPLLPIALVSLMLLVVSCQISKLKTQDPFNWAQQILGTYQGKIWSSGAIASVSTTFKISHSGFLNGEYQVREDNKTVSGELKSCQEIEKRKIKCNWEDSYGKGILKATFSQDYIKFEGVWHLEGQEENYPWNGVKE